MKSLKFNDQILIPVEDKFYTQLEEELNQIVVLSSLLDKKLICLALLHRRNLSENEIRERKQIHLKDNENYLLFHIDEKRQAAIVIRWYNGCKPHEVYYYAEIKVEDTMQYGYIELESKNNSERLLEALLLMKNSI